MRTRSISMRCLTLFHSIMILIMLPASFLLGSPFICIHDFHCWFSKISFEFWGFIYIGQIIRRTMPVLLPFHRIFKVYTIIFAGDSKGSLYMHLCNMASPKCTNSMPFWRLSKQFRRDFDAHLNRRKYGEPDSFASIEAETAKSLTLAFYQPMS